MNENLNILKIVKLNKNYKTLFKKGFSLRGLNFEVKKGKITGFLGPNGAGKTTTINIILGLIKKDGGDIKLFDSKIENPEVRKRIGYLPENPNFYGFLKGIEILRISGSLYSLSREKIEERIKFLEEKFDLKRELEKKVSIYSKGMLQKIAFSVAVLHEPDLLILDEPYNGLDPILINSVRDYILELKQDGKTIFISSHLLSEMEKICDDVILINNGKIILKGELKDLKNDKKYSSPHSLEQIFLETVKTKYI
ncbi:MAG: ABC transporter ATP-binding protein [Acidobacteriota bacterium]